MLGSSSVTHVEEAEARKCAEFEKTLVKELLLHLAELDCRHFCTVGGELAIGLGLEVDELLFGRRGLERGEKFFFEHGEGAVEVVEGGRVGAAHGGG